MPGNPIDIVHFNNGSGGGVLSVIKNLLRFSTNSNIKNHIIYAINRAIVPHYSIESIEGASSQQIYYYSATNNFYHTCRQLGKLLPGEGSVIVAHDWVELGMVSNLGLQNPVIQVLHGDVDYYYELAEKHNSAVDAFICISPNIFQTLKKRLPGRLEDIFYLNFPVPEIKLKSKPTGSLQLIYYVNNLRDNRKQFSTICQIARLLQDSGDDYFFTIGGGGMTRDEFFELWPLKMRKKVNFVGLVSNENVADMLLCQHVFLLPSITEGFPVSLVEAMKAGAVPLVTNWGGAADELIMPGITGYYFNVGAAADYASCIINLKENRQLLNQLSLTCAKKANQLFDPVNNTKAFENTYQNISGKESKIKEGKKAYGSRLDEPWIANVLTRGVRGMKRIKS